MNLSPIVLFAFSRPQSLQNCIESLQKNTLAKESELFIFVDGARSGKEGEAEKVLATQEIAKSVTGFRSVTCEFSEENKGLYKSWLQGIGYVVKKFGKVIVVEDDLIFAPNFLAFINDGLNRYENADKIFSICAYSNKINVPKNYEYDSYFCTRAGSWGWGTWKNRFESVDWELTDWELCKKMKSAFNRWGGSDCYKMLIDSKNNKISSFSIRFCFSQFLQDKISLFALKSKVKNTGFDKEATHTKQKWNRFKSEFDTSGKIEFKFPEKIEVNKELRGEFMKYHSVFARMFTKIRNIL